MGVADNLIKFDTFWTMTIHRSSIINHRDHNTINAHYSPFHPFNETNPTPYAVGDEPFQFLTTTKERKTQPQETTKERTMQNNHKRIKPLYT